MFQNIHTYICTAFNPNSVEYVRNKYRKRVEQFKWQCKITEDLSVVMSRGYQDPTEQPADYRHMMCVFMKMKEAGVHVE